jgi:hypothetical protein
MSDEQKKEALAKLDEKVKLAKQALREAQAIADDNGLSFRFSMDLPSGNKGRRRYKHDYSPSEVGGIYHGKGSEDEYYEPEEDGDPDTKALEEGFWGWTNSSLNC